VHHLYRRADGTQTGFGPAVLFDVGFPDASVTGPNLSADGLELYFSVTTNQPKHSALHRMVRTDRDAGFGPAAPVDLGGWSGDVRSSSLSRNGSWMVFFSYDPPLPDGGYMGHVYLSKRACRDAAWTYPARYDLPADPGARTAGTWQDDAFRPEWGPGDGLFFDYSEDGGPQLSDVLFAGNPSD
jgi:hypothetical protein